MLEKLLQLVATGGVHSHAALAEELDVTEPLLGSMIAGLVRLRYLCPAEGTCPSRYEGCPMQETCGIGSGGRLWVLTEPGERAARAEGTKGAEGGETWN
ncbi:MAG: hypothetical protein KKA73_11415 [Chloroflexi bacterium]|nr:hypothetical protein [Chloroflexota bacterium]